MIALARQCIRFHELLATLITRELRGRYRGSLLGSSWLIVQPLIFLVIYYVVFSQFLKAAMPSEVLDRRPGWFALAMFTGLIPWIGFSEALNRGMGCVIENGNLIKKFAFPSELLPAYLVAVGLIHSLIGFSILTLAVFILHGELPHLAGLLPLMLLLQGIFTLGVAYLFSAVTVFIRDVGHMLPLILNLGFFLTPIFFVQKFTTEPVLSEIFKWNPLSYLIETYRVIFILHPQDMKAVVDSLPPGARGRLVLQPVAAGEVPWPSIAIFAAVSVVLLAVGYRVFMWLKPRFPDEV